MFKWIGKKIEKFTTIFHGGVLIESEASNHTATISGDYLPLSIKSTDSITPSASLSYHVANIENRKTGSTGDSLINTGNLLYMRDLDTSSNHASSTTNQIGIDLALYKLTDFTGNCNQTGLKMLVSGQSPGLLAKGIDLTVENEGIDIIMRSSSNTVDYSSIATTENGGTTITTVDADAALAHFEIAADGDITLDSAGQIKLEPVAGNNILLDGTITVDAGVVAGATSITSTEFHGDGGNLTGITATTAGTVTTGAQPNIDSIGTDGDTLSILSDTLLMSNTSADTPVIKLVNTTDDDQAGQLIFEKLRDDDAVASGQNLGEIWFKGQDANQNTEDYAFIVGEIDVSTHGQESGILRLGVTSHDGSDRGGLKLIGGSEATEVDVEIGRGANSVVTIPGNIDLAGDIDVDGTLETDALTIGGAAVLAQATLTAAGATELATRAEATTGTDSTRAITADGLKAHVDARYSYQYISFSFKATNIAPDTWITPSEKGPEYFAWNDNLDGQSDAPKDVDIETTITVDYLEQSTGFVIPKTCKLDGFYGNSKVNGTSPNTLRPVIGFFTAAEPADGNTTDLTATCVAFDSYDTASGNRRNRFLKLESLGLDTTLTQGDILFPAIGFDATADDSNGDMWGSYTIVLKTLIP